MSFAVVEWWDGAVWQTETPWTGFVYGSREHHAVCSAMIRSRSGLGSYRCRARLGDAVLWETPAEIAAEHEVDLFALASACGEVSDSGREIASQLRAALALPDSCERVARALYWCVQARREMPPVEIQREVIRLVRAVSRVWHWT